jgi:hypothetical protein
MSKHTPGPWVVDEKAKIKHPEGTLIGQAQYWTDASLMAAAPDLLEALQELLATSLTNSLEIVGRDTDGHPLNAAGVARKKARAAIAKATGEA